MSRTTTKYVTADGDVDDGEEYGNSHGVGPFIWDALNVWYRPQAQRGAVGDGWSRLWEDEGSGSLVVEPFEHNALHLTYDNALVRRDDCSTLVASLRTFVARHRRPDAPRVCHLADIANEIERRLAEDATWIAFGLHGTDICEDPWMICDAESGEFESYNINRGDKHWFIEVRP